ncbi:MAG: ATP-binding protein [Clostridia bacterium]|nr:ATP-binding protein [Clostridia bacterium]
MNTYIALWKVTLVDLLIFNKIENDSCIKGVLEKNNVAVLRGIIEFSETEGVTSSAIKEYVATRLANDDNILSHLAQSDKQIGDDLYKLALLDIEQIYKKLFSIQIKYSPSGNQTGFYDGYINSIKAITEAASAGELLDRLINHYRTLGSGILSKYTAFKYDGALAGVSETDAITFGDLVGIEHQKQTLIENTKAFVHGKAANNVLLFGDRGTGKSSSVKALLNMFRGEGLRMIEMPKYFIKDIPKLSKQLADSPGKYIIFLDDLTFEKHESEYRDLKVAMEGQLQANPDNVLIYATSNRRHLIRENWSDREGGDVHVNDHMQETLSLSERFGISLVFSAPTQKEYLNIVSEMLKKHNMEMNGDIEKQAIVWQMNYGGRSARCAKQFVTSYISK